MAAPSIMRANDRSSGQADMDFAIRAEWMRSVPFPLGHLLIIVAQFLPRLLALRKNFRCRGRVYRSAIMNGG